MTREDNFRVREGVHGEWCVDEAVSVDYKFVARAASELDARRLCAKLNGHPVPASKAEEPKTVASKLEKIAKRWTFGETMLAEIEAAGLSITEKERG